MTDLRHYHICYFLWIPAILLGIAGVLAIYSASLGYHSDYVSRQLLWLAMGLLLAVGVSLIPHLFFHHYAAIIYGFSLLSLLAVLIFGQERNGAKAWLGFGSFGIQPSEFTKIAVIFLFGRYFADFEEHRYSWKYYLMSFGILAIPMALILLQPDLGTMLTFFPVVVAMFLVTGTKLSLLLTTFLGVLAAFPPVWMFLLKNHQKQRFLLTWHPERDPWGFGYQALMSKLTLGSGMLFGRGYGESRMSKLNFLPERHTDFIFSVFGEEWGFVGSVLLLCLYFFLILAALRIARGAKDLFGVTVATGIAVLIATHVIMNVGMCTGMMPVIGVPLPLFSYGGSSLLCTMISLGVLQSIYADSTK
ncbi:rod shape-determining protein RodA [bacterium]|jgi:rod shape determining protein RodA|nr:rod shape-determining protein RodA [bacterium]